MIKQLACTLVALAFAAIANAQITGGRNTYDFLSLSYSARVTALGGNLITVKDNDLSLALQNPAALNAEMHNSATIQQSIYFAGISYGYAGYAHHIKKVPLTVHGGIQYVNYGKFKRTSSNGDLVGDFRASDFAIGGGVSYQATDRLSFGTNQKVVLSYLEGYNSVGWSSDWAGLYQDTSKGLTFSLVLRNLGTQFTTYDRDGNRQRLPFDAQFGASLRLKHAPFRLSIIGHHLHKWNIRYDDPALAESSILGTPTIAPTKATAGEVVDNIFRHLIFNIELLLGKKDVFRLRVGYDRLRQGEMAVSGLRTLAGFSAGFGIKVYKFNIDYGLSSYHIGGTVHHFGISTRLSSF